MVPAADLDQVVVELERRLHRLRCEVRRLTEELDYAHERERVLRRIIMSQAHELQTAVPGV